MVEINLNYILQLTCIISGILGITTSFYQFIAISNLPSFILGSFVIVFSIFLISAEIYIFSFFKYFAFILTNWGKSILYLFIGALLYNSNYLINLICSFLFWLLFIFFILMEFYVGKVSIPLYQKEDLIDLDVKTNEFFKK